MLVSSTTTRQTPWPSSAGGDGVNRMTKVVLPGDFRHRVFSADEIPNLTAAEVACLKAYLAIPPTVERPLSRVGRIGSYIELVIVKAASYRYDFVVFLEVVSMVNTNPSRIMAMRED